MCPVSRGHAQPRGKRREKSTAKINSFPAASPALHFPRMKSAAVPSRKLKPGQVARKAALIWSVRDACAESICEHALAYSRGISSADSRPRNIRGYGECHGGEPLPPLFCKRMRPEGEGCGFPENESMWCAPVEPPNVGRVEDPAVVHPPNFRR